MKKLIIPALLGAALLSTTNAAEAAKRSFIITGSDLMAQGGSSPTAIGIDLPNASTSVASVNITLPKNYKKNTPIAVLARLLTGNTNCTVVLAANSVIRLRPGLALASGTGATSGFTIVGSTAVATPTVPTQVFSKEFKLKKATTGAILNQKAGDNIIIAIVRDGAAVADTCTGVLGVTSVKITYTTN